MKYLNNYKIFESITEAKDLMVNPTSNMKDNYNKVIKTIDIVNTAFGFKSSKELLKEIPMVETRLGTVPGSVRTTGTRGRGLWQIDEISFKDITERGTKELKGLFDKFKNATGVDLLQCQWNDCNTFLVGCVFAILVMRLRGIKTDITSRLDRAETWKKHYNTIKGKGTVEKYWNTVQEILNTLGIKDDYTNKTYAMVVKERELLAAPDTEKIFKEPYVAKVDNTYVAKTSINNE